MVTKRRVPTRNKMNLFLVFYTALAVFIVVLFVIKLAIEILPLGGPRRSGTTKRKSTVSHIGRLWYWKTFVFFKARPFTDGETERILEYFDYLSMTSEGYQLYDPLPIESAYEISSDEASKPKKKKKNGKK